MTNCSLLGFDFVEKKKAEKEYYKLLFLAARLMVFNCTNKISRQLPYDTELKVFLLMLLLSNFTFQMHDSWASIILRNLTVFKEYATALNSV